jgi:NADH:ubiquinone oxidoreductase subunit 5 (subunit L)/multisubunit Na+/H+ antiporter MnhA subunit
MILNRVGDFGLAIAIFVCYFIFKTLDYHVLFSLVPFFFQDMVYFFDMPISLLDFISFFLFVGAMGKSAQLGLHT